MPARGKNHSNVSATKPTAKCPRCETVFISETDWTGNGMLREYCYPCSRIIDLMNYEEYAPHQVSNSMKGGGKPKK